MDSSRARGGRPRRRDLSPFGRNVRELIELHPRLRSRNEFLRKMDLASQTFYRYETGERPPPSDVLERAADLLDTTVDHLLGRDEEAEAVEYEPSTEEAVEAFLAGPYGGQVTGNEAELLRRLRFGGVTPTPGMIQAIWLELRVQQGA